MRVSSQTKEQVNGIKSKIKEIEGFLKLLKP